MGADSVSQQLRLPLVVGRYFTEQSQEIDLNPSQMQLAGLLIRPAAPVSEEESKTGISEDAKERIIRLYKKGVKVQYLTELFGIESPQLVHSWGNWTRRPYAEAESNLALRGRIQSLLRQGEMPKSICTQLRLKPKTYRELLGQSSGQVYSRATYESVKHQMNLLKVKNIVSKNTGVSLYILNKWLEDKNIPREDLVVSDETGLRETKLEAIELFYDTGSCASVGMSLGLESEQVREWLGRFQSAVDGESALGLRSSV